MLKEGKKVDLRALVLWKTEQSKRECLVVSLGSPRPAYFRCWGILLRRTFEITIEFFLDVVGKSEWNALIFPNGLALYG